MRWKQIQKKEYQHEPAEHEVKDVTNEGRIRLVKRLAQKMIKKYTELGYPRRDLYPNGEELETDSRKRGIINYEINELERKRLRCSSSSKS